MKLIRYTIRNVPSELDAKLRSKARREKKSLNQLVIELLSHSVNNSPTGTARHHDYDEYVGMWVDDPGFDEAMKDMRVVDPRDWQ